MGLKEEFVKVVDNVKDAASEVGHKATAEGEQSRRDIAGDQMTPGQNAESMLNQAKNNVQAGIDRAKQDARNGT